MKKILVLGAGLSSSYLIKYLAEHAPKEGYTVILADSNLANAQNRGGKYKSVQPIQLDINNKELAETLIAESSIVISLLPPSLHVMAAKLCIKHQRHLITASYVSQEMQKLNNSAIKANVLLLNEMGLDPGIDHMSAMKIIHHIQEQGGEVVSFKSHCGGLVAPEHDNNPWNYKFTWNPQNVVLAGQSAATYLHENQIKYIPPQHIFSLTEEVLIPNLGKFESYANRDSLAYIEAYGIKHAKTVFRGTLRRPGFCQNWQTLINLGLTDDKLTILNSHKLTNREFLCAFIPGANTKNLEVQLCRFLDISIKSSIFQKLKWLGLLEPTQINLHQASPAAILKQILMNKWKLDEGDLDMVVMKHDITYKMKGKNYKIHSAFSTKGKDHNFTAMAKTVGLPMAIAAKLIIQNRINLKGVQIPVQKQIYEPVLKELIRYDVKFTEW